MPGHDVTAATNQQQSCGKYHEGQCVSVYEGQSGLWGSCLSCKFAAPTLLSDPIIGWATRAL